MKRFWIGIWLLAALLASALLTGWAMPAVHDPVARDLAAAEAAAAAGTQDLARRRMELAEDRWVKWQTLRGCLADHTPVEEIDAQFALLNSYLHQGELTEFSALAAQTARMVEAIGKAHSLGWESFF